MIIFLVWKHIIDCAILKDMQIKEQIFFRAKEGFENHLASFNHYSLILYNKTKTQVG